MSRLRNLLNFNKAFTDTRKDFRYLSILGLALLFYLVGNQSRAGLAESNSSIFSKNLSEKILLLLLGFVIVAVLLTIFPKILERISVRSDDGTKSLKLANFLPNLAFTCIVALPVLIQRHSNNAVISLFYKVIRVGNSNPNFLDLRQTIYYLADLKIHKIGDKGYIYPEILLKLRPLAKFIINPLPQTLIGIFFIILFNLVIWDFSRLLFIKSKIVFTFLLITPPIQLLFDRMNIDIPILIILYLAAKLITKNRIAFNLLSCLLISATICLKFYTFPILFLFLTLKKNRIDRIIIGVFIVLNLIIVFQDLKAVAKFQIRDLAGTFGLPTLLAHYAGAQTSGFYIFTQGSLLLLIVTSVILTGKIKSIRRDKPQSNSQIFYIFASIFISTFFLSNNYMYRLYPLLFIIPLLVNSRDAQSNSAGALALISTLFGVRTTGILMNLLLLPLVIELAAQVLSFAYFELFMRSSAPKDGF